LLHKNRRPIRGGGFFMAANKTDAALAFRVIPEGG